MSDIQQSDLGRSSITWTIGYENDPKPTKLGIINLDRVLGKSFWTATCRRPEWSECCSHLDTYRENVRTALNEYPAFKGIKNPTGEFCLYC